MTQRSQTVQEKLGGTNKHEKIATAPLSCALAATLAGSPPTPPRPRRSLQEPHTAALTATAAASVKSPKYVFLFIGDGMSYPQIQSTSDYLGALKDADYWQAQPSLDDNQGAILDGPEYLNFMNFEAAGSAVTYDSNSFAPDSASTATSIATGHKTYSAPSTWTKPAPSSMRPLPSS